MGSAPHTAQVPGGIEDFLARHRPPSPCLVVDLDTVRRRYQALRALLPAARIYYAVKANPAREVIAALRDIDIGFDLASPGEMNRCLTEQIAPARFCYGNTIKRESDIAAAHAAGVGMFAFDSAAELRKLARAAPGARVFCRIAVPGRHAEWPLTRKFGCIPDIAAQLLLEASALGLHPSGVSFHVGSQQIDPGQWRIAIGRAVSVFHACARQGLALSLLNVGGGLPATYRDPVPPIERYAEAILSAVHHHFGADAPDLMIEPGRYLVGDAGLLRSQVLLIARHGRADGRRWVYLDAGRYNGLPETQNEAIQYISGRTEAETPPNRWRSPDRPATAPISFTNARIICCRPTSRSATPSISSARALIPPAMRRWSSTVFRR